MGKIRSGPWTISIRLETSSKKNKMILKKKSMKGSVMLMNLQADKYNKPVWLFNLIPSEGAVYI